MEPSILERNVKNLEGSLASLEYWLAVMTLLVVVGLVIEYWYELPEAVASLRTAWSWKPFCIIVGGILITVGVAGELAVQHFASQKETELRKANDAVFANLNSEAAGARKQAGDAVLRASKADERASANEKEAAQLRKDAESERLARVELESKVAWRTLPDKQQKALISALSSFAGTTWKFLIPFRWHGSVFVFSGNSNCPACSQVASSPAKPKCAGHEGNISPHNGFADRTYRFWRRGL